MEGPARLGLTSGALPGWWQWTWRGEASGERLGHSGTWCRPLWTAQPEFGLQ